MTTADLTADLTVVADTPSGPAVLLVLRSTESDAYPGWWALPGGYLETGETFLDAAEREAEEETGIAVPRADIRFVGVYDTPDRDPRGRVVSGAHAVRLGDAPGVEGRDDAAEAAWWPIENLPKLAFDHDQVLHDALRALEIRRLRR